VGWRLAVPQVRDGDFYPQSLEEGLRSERVLKLVLAKMYVHSGPSGRSSSGRVLSLSQNELEKEI
jgi:transposase-like protein